MKHSRAIGVALMLILAVAAGCRQAQIAEDGPDGATPRPGNGCGTFRHGDRETRTRYREPTVALEASCVSETQIRTCNDGTLGPWSGTYQHATCSPPGQTGVSLVPPTMTSGSEASPSVATAVEFSGSLIFAGMNGRGVQKTFRYHERTREVTQLPSTTNSETKNDSASLFVRYRNHLYFTAYGPTGNRGIFRYSPQLTALETVIMTSNRELFAIQDLKVLGAYLYVRIASTAGDFPLFFRIDSTNAVTQVAPWDQQPLAAQATGIPYESGLTTLNGKFYYSGLKILPSASATSRVVTIGGTRINAASTLYEYSPATSTVRPVLGSEYDPISSSLVIKGVLGSRLVVEALGRAVYLLAPASGQMTTIPNAPLSIISTAPWGSSLIFSAKQGSRHKLYELRANGTVASLGLNADVPLCGQNTCFYSPTPFLVHSNYVMYSDDGRNGAPANDTFAKSQLPATNGAHRVRVFNFTTRSAATLLGTGYQLVNFGGYAGTSGYSYFYASDSELRSRYYRWDLNGRPDLVPSPAPSPESTTPPAITDPPGDT